MFENLNNPNPSNRQSVDDIFAETDSSADSHAHPNESDIITRKVGIAASSDINSTVPSSVKPEKSGNGFKIAVICMVTIIIGLLAFLAYTKFFKPADEVNNQLAPIDNVENSEVVDDNDNTVTPNVDDNVVVPTTDSGQVGEQPAFVDELPGTATSTTSQEANNSTSSEQIILATDTDNDSLTDDEELLAQTNLNLADTDGDGLSDYVEIKIYKTNPLVRDTDGDSYSDNEEVTNGYNPNGPGKLPGNVE